MPILIINKDANFNNKLQLKVARRSTSPKEKRKKERKKERKMFSRPAGASGETSWSTQKKKERQKEFAILYRGLD